MQRLTEDLLLLAQAGEGRLEVQAEDVAAAEVLSEVRDQFRAAAAAEGRRVTMGPAEGVVRADRRQLQHALANLVGNALEHGRGDVRLSARPNGEGLTLVVADHGDGFDGLLLDHATERFVRSAESTGAGLGLAIVAAVAEAHGGTVAVANVSGGAEASLSLPRAKARPRPVSLT